MKYERFREALRKTYGPGSYKIDAKDRLHVYGRLHPQIETPWWHEVGKAEHLNALFCKDRLPLPYLVIPAFREVPGEEFWPFPIGSKVKHAYYGEGTILGYPHNNSIYIRFDLGDIVFRYDQEALTPVANI